MNNVVEKLLNNKPYENNEELFFTAIKEETQFHYKNCTEYHKFCNIKAFKYELGGYVVQIDDEYKGASEELMPLSTNIKNSYNPLITSESPNFKKAYWARRDNALSTFVDGDENINEHYFIAGFTEKYDYEHQKLLGLNTPYINFVINNDKS